jgi:hypothetical protein
MFGGIIVLSSNIDSRFPEPWIQIVGSILGVSFDPFDGRFGVSGFDDRLGASRQLRES